MSTETNLKEPRVYEVGYILSPVISEENLDSKIDTLRKAITDHKGLPIAEGRAELLELAYPMHKVIENKKQEFTKGYFGWIKFDATPDKVAELKKVLDGMNELIRYIVITTVRENTLVGSKVFAKNSSKNDTEEKVDTKKKLEPSQPEEIDEEEVDAKIDELASDVVEE